MKRPTLFLSLGLITCTIALTACGDDPSSSLTSQDVACMKIQTAGGSCAGASSSSSTVTSTVTLTNSVTTTATSVTTVTTVNTSS